jgi:hypothetical protein
MSEDQVQTGAGTPVSEVQTGAQSPAVAEQTAPRPTAIKLIEQELLGFIKQREQAVANVHALEGAIQAGQHILAKLRGEVAKAEAEAKKVLGAVEHEAGNVVEFVKKEL